MGLSDGIIPLVCYDASAARNRVPSKEYYDCLRVLVTARYATGL